MPATITTKEEFKKNIPVQNLHKEVQLRLLAGAIRSIIKDLNDKWIIETEWNVYGQQ